MNFLYVFAAGRSPWEDHEIRYSLRSVDLTFDSARVCIAGPAVPPFLTGITHIKADIDPALGKFKNMQRQLREACLSSSVAEKLILMNDDFLVRPTPVWDWTPTITGPIEKVSKRKQGNNWFNSLVATGEWLRQRGIANPMSYEGHTPMPFRKSLALPILEDLLASEIPLQFRSAYGNIVGIGGKLHPNAKRADPDKWPVDSPFWSLKGRPNDKAKMFLENWLTEPSRWEVRNG